MARWWAIACAGITALAIAATAFADARTDYLVRVLRTSPMFRVRTQAAISLGGVETEPAVIEALVRALRDGHPAVRAAAASALERHGDPSALSALRRATNDPEAAVRNAASRAVRRLERMARSRPRSRAVPRGGSNSDASSAPARYYVAVGRPGTKVRSVSRSTLEALQGYIRQQVEGIPGVALAPENERASAANRVIRQRDLVGYFLDSSIVAFDTSGGGVSARVSVVVQSYPDRNIRSMLQGSARTASGRGAAVERQVLEAAFRSALRGLPGFLRTASAQASRPRRRR